MSHGMNLLGSLWTGPIVILVNFSILIQMCVPIIKKSSPSLLLGLVTGYLFCGYSVVSTVVWDTVKTREQEHTICRVILTSFLTDIIFLLTGWR